ncbi:hypothetical protein [Faecalispora anaeroviscerum]|uniref:hypothetical protein n=1 Tax=Faecalispora anaeroviscerum TaxID=2991836 RepID=UPI0024BB6788|nr:hypothetical protein [Faecalispora anaeroviscerum]
MPTPIPAFSGSKRTFNWEIDTIFNLIFPHKLISSPANGMIVLVDTLCEQYLIMTGVELDDK